MGSLFVLVKLVTLTVPNERAEVSQAVWSVALDTERTFVWLSSEPGVTLRAGELDISRKCQRSVG